MNSSSTNHVTALLARWSEGDVAAREALIAAVYPELRRLAGSCLSGHQPQTLQSNSSCIDDTSRVRGVSPASVKREWAAARLWLLRELKRSDPA